MTAARSLTATSMVRPARVPQQSSTAARASNAQLWVPLSAGWRAGARPPGSRTLAHNRLISFTAPDPRITDYETLLQNIADLKAGRPAEVRWAGIVHLHAHAARCSHGPCLLLCSPCNAAIGGPLPGSSAC